ncbi:hypothetical protein [Geothrix sp. 21YS21S-2]|uniref:hypothetical protein n=1 Tax=Geothrix sp. 21YS21S-2 TaxID=3068893 RepID=UPI0027B89BB4|nr:hypothetical protein [Geothrix sp. 21YS21S-2]
MRFGFPGLAVLLAVSAGPLGAGDTSWAFQLGAMAPQGSLKSDPQAGAQQSLGGPVLGLLFERSFRTPDAVRLRLSLAGLRPGGRNPLGTGGAYTESDWSLPEVGLDWRHQWTGSTSGWYSTVGLGLASPRLDRTAHWPLSPGGPVVGGTTRFTQHHKPAARIGGGWQFNHRFSAEGAYHFVNVDSAPQEGFGVSRLAWFELAVGIHWGRGR